MLDLFQAIILGIVQGLTEFIPISSSAHLIFIPYFFGWPEPGLSFSIALHLGTLLALLVYFWRDIISLLAALVASIRYRSLAGDPNRKLAWLLILGTIPAGLAGLLGDQAIESAFHSPENMRVGLFLISGLMIILGALLLFAEHRAKHIRSIEHLRLGDAIVIGLAQALALLPGVSRSGGTITAGLLMGIKRADAARFSFLLAIPAVGGAGLVSLKDLAESSLTTSEQQAFVVGFLSAAISGYLCIKYLLRYLQRGTVDVFAYYRFGIAAVVIALLLIWR